MPLASHHCRAQPDPKGPRQSKTLGNWKLARWQEPRTLTRDVLREMRRGRPAGMSRRTLIRRSIGAGVGLWLLEVTGGLLGFLWPNLSRGFGGEIQLGDLTTVSG